MKEKNQEIKKIMITAFTLGVILTIVLHFVENNAPAASFTL